MRGSSFGVAVSATATCMVGGSAEGRRGGALVGALAVVAALAAGVTAVAAPVTAAAARNLRRLTPRDADVFVPLSSSVDGRSAGLRSTPPDSNFCVDIIVAAACCKVFRSVACVVRSLKRRCRLEAAPCCE